jgi:hypothetical protein
MLAKTYLEGATGGGCAGNTRRGSSAGGAAAFVKVHQEPRETVCNAQSYFVFMRYDTTFYNTIEKDTPTLDSYRIGYVSHTIRSNFHRIFFEIEPMRET